jgi:hypothetical protein
MAAAVAVRWIHGFHLQVGSRDYRLAEANLVPQSNSLEDGLLPANIFRSIFISNSEGYIVIEPNK